MTIISTWAAFRWYAAVKHVSSGNFAFVDANPDTITRAVGSFVADGVVAGMVCQPAGTVSNNRRRYTVDTVAALTLTLSAADAVVAEPAVASTLTSFYLDNDGVEEFPGPLGHTNLMRAAGFDAGFTGIPHPAPGGVGASFDVSCNAGAVDAVPGVDEYHWYLSQRTDDPARQYLSVSRLPCPTYTPDTRSGSVRIRFTTLANTDFGVVTSTTPETLCELFKHTHLYCLRVSDGAIQWVDVLAEMFKDT